MADLATYNQHELADQATGGQHMTEEIHQPEPGHGDSGNPLLTLDVGMVFWTWVIFFVLLYALRKHAWKPILDSLDERETSIREALDDAQAAREALEAASEEQRKLIRDSRHSAATVLDAARRTATEAADERLKEARGEAERMIGDAGAQVERQKDIAVDELRSSVEDLSVMVAAKLLNTDLDDPGNRKRAKDYITELPG